MREMLAKFSKEALIVYMAENLWLREKKAVERELLYCEWARMSKAAEQEMDAAIKDIDKAKDHTAFLAGQQRFNKAQKMYDKADRIYKLREKL